MGVVGVSVDGGLGGAGRQDDLGRGVEVGVAVFGCMEEIKEVTTQGQSFQLLFRRP